MNDEKLIINSVQSFRIFLNNIFWAGQNIPNFKKTPHLDKWADLMQSNKNVALLSARRHLKSYLMYAWVMWNLFRGVNENIEILYISLKEDLARYHIRNIKRLIQMNPYFAEYRDMSSAESEIKGTWSKSDYEKICFIHRVTPSGMESLKRGMRGNILCDDILADPTLMMEPVKIEKANRIFFEEIMSIPREGEWIKVVGTAQHTSDLFFKLKDNKSFAWSINPSIINHENKEVLWPELFPYERLIEIRDCEIGDRAFSKEYQCIPQWSADSFFRRDQLSKLIDLNLKNRDLTEGKPSHVSIVAGFDVGKHAHPSHLSVFEVGRDGIYRQIYQIFFDNWDYIKQVEFVNALAERLMIDRIQFDNTRGEFESFLETGICPRNLWRPMRFDAKGKMSWASNFEKFVIQGKLRLQNDERMIRSILGVNNNLDALETADGHSDAFWSIALALSCKQSQPYEVFGANRK